MASSTNLKNFVFDFERNQTPCIHDYFNFISLIEAEVKKINALTEPLEHRRAKYPIDQHGFAIAFDPVMQPFEVISHWREFGFVVFKNVINPVHIKDAVSFIENLISSENLLSEKCIRDPQGTPLLSRGFLEVYHHQTLANMRQSLRLYIAYSLLWNTSKIWISFDRFGLKPPVGDSSVGLGLHVDQNPCVHPGFQTIQAVVALSDCPATRGTFVAVPGSVAKFKEYSQFVRQGYVGEYVELKDSYLKEEMTLYRQLIPLRAGNVVAWDSRTTHANSSNSSDKNRYVAYISAGVAKTEPALIEQRKSHYQSGLGVNIRDAYLHASMKPRFTSSEFNEHIRQGNSENLSILGELLYGLLPYEDLK